MKQICGAIGCITKTLSRDSNIDMFQGTKAWLQWITFLHQYAADPVLPWFGFNTCYARIKEGNHVHRILFGLIKARKGQNCSMSSLIAASHRMRHCRESPRQSGTALESPDSVDLGTGD